MKWKSIITAVNIETGEEIPRRKVENKEYIIVRKKINKTRTIIDKNHEQHRERNITWECKPNNQLKLF